MGEWLSPPPLKQSLSDPEGLGSIPVEGKLDSEIPNWSENEYPRIKLGLRIHFDSSPERE